MASRMIDPQAIKELLDENVDEDAMHLAILTTHGTLLAFSPLPPATNTPTQRSLCALIGLTWRRHHASLHTHHTPSPDIQHVKTIRLTHPPKNPYQLQGMVVEWEGMVAAVEEVKAGVLVAVQRPVGGRGEDGVDEGGEVSVLRRLELRAQGMAEAVAGEWPGSLPEGFY